MKLTGRRRLAVVILVPALTAVGCRAKVAGPQRASGYVEATEVRVAPEVGGRVLEVKVSEGDTVAAGTAVARLDTSDVEIALRRAHADRDQAVAQLRLLTAGARAEDIRQASAQAESADAEVQAAESELANAAADVQRFEALLKANAGSRKQRDDAATRRDVAAARVAAARQRARAATEGRGPAQGRVTCRRNRRSASPCGGDRTPRLKRFRKTRETQC